MIFFSVIFILSIAVKSGAVEVQPAKFRILAPQFICPKDDGAPIEKPDNTVITIQTQAHSETQFSWSVRWSPLAAPSQRETLMLWKAVRALEARLNRPQPEPLVYIIQNSELLTGVDYLFNVTAIEPNGEVGSHKSFHIDNTQDDLKLSDIEGRGDMMSIILVGGQTSYADLPFVLEAQITTCSPTQDYYFIWTVEKTQSDDVVISNTGGYRLEIPPFSLKAGQTYDVDAQVIKKSNNQLITRTGLIIELLTRPLRVYVNVDYLFLTVNKAITINTLVTNQDFNDEIVSYEWNCTFAGKACDIEVESLVNSTLHLPVGLTDIGQYDFNILVTIGDQSATAEITVVTVEPTLPVIMIPPMARVVNEGSIVQLTANVSNVAPTCTLTWYFASNEHMVMDLQTNETCDDCLHGEPLSDTLTIFSLQENFLNELTDFTNETEWRQVSAAMPAAGGRARFVAQCGCSLTFECDTLGTVYADLHFTLNESPKTNDLKVSPASGSALETVFRLSTLAALDPDTPIKYTFYCAVSTNDTLLLDYFTEQLAMETVLPFVDGGTEVWVEACDSFRACSRSESVLVALTASDGSTIELMIEDVRGHVQRCELAALRRAAVLAMASYSNAGQPDLMSRFTEPLIAAMKQIDELCVQDAPNKSVYSDLLSWVNRFGSDTDNTLQ